MSTSAAATASALSLATASLSSHPVLKKRNKRRDELLDSMFSSREFLLWDVCEDAIWSKVKRLKVLGTGSYGTVYLVQLKADPSVEFALKIFSLAKSHHAKICLYEIMASGLMNVLHEVTPPATAAACLLYQAYVCRKKDGAPTRICTIMEVADGTLREFRKSTRPSESLLDCAFIQVLVNLLSPAMTFSMVHHDLYTRNVFYFNIPSTCFAFKFQSGYYLLCTTRLFLPADFGFVTTPVLSRKHNSLSRGQGSLDDFVTEVKKGGKVNHVLKFDGIPVFSRDVASLAGELKTPLASKALSMLKSKPPKSTNELFIFVETLLGQATCLKKVKEPPEGATIIHPRDASAEIDISPITALLDCSSGGCVPTSGPVSEAYKVADVTRK